MQTPGLTELNAVAAVAARKNFRAAAKDLDVSASALSHAVAALEARLGVRLFHRTTRSVSLTAAGERFLDRITPAMREISDAMLEANDQRKTPAGLIRINTSAAAGEQILAPVVMAFLRRYPDIQVEVVTDGRLVDIVAEGFDAGVRLAEMVPLDMVSIPFGSRQQHIAVAAPSYLANRAAPQLPSELKDHVCVRYRLPGGALYAWEFQKRGELVRVDVSGPLTLDSDRLILRAALEGAGIAYVSAWNAANALKQGQLVQVLEDWTPPYPGLCFYYPRHRQTSAGMRAFVEFLRELAVNARPSGEKSPA